MISDLQNLFTYPCTAPVTTGTRILPKNEVVIADKCPRPNHVQYKF